MPETPLNIEAANKLIFDVRTLQEDYEARKAAGDGVAEIKERQGKFEADLAKLADQMVNLGKPEPKRDVREEFNKDMRLAMRGVCMQISPEERAAFDAQQVQFRTTALGITNASTGSFLTSPEYVNEIIKIENDLSPIRQYAKVINIGKGEAQIPRKKTRPTTESTDEGGISAETDPTVFELVTVPVRQYSASTPITQWMLEDSNFDIASIITADVAESFAIDEGADFLNGVGPTEPEGIMTNSNVSHIASGESTELLSADKLIDLVCNIKSGYLSKSPVFVMERATFAKVVALKGGTSSGYVFQFAMNMSLPTAILGYPIVLAEDMPTIGAGTFPILFGSLKSAYTIVDRLDLQAMIDPYTKWGSGYTLFNFRKRVGGAVVNPEAITKLEIAAS
jgi:HK97 family phage major capsid protein